MEIITNWWGEIINFVILSLALATYFQKRINTVPDLKVWGWILFINVIVECIATYLTYKGINNLILYHFLYLLSIALISFFLISVIDFENRKITVMVYFLVVALSLSIAVFGEPLNKYPSSIVMFKNTVFIALCFCYFRKILLSKYQNKNLYSLTFWIVAGVFIYSFSGLIIEGMMSYYILKKREIADAIFLYWLILNYLFWLHLLLGFLRYKSASN